MSGSLLASQIGTYRFDPGATTGRFTTTSLTNYTLFFGGFATDGSNYYGGVWASATTGNFYVFKWTLAGVISMQKRGTVNAGTAGNTRIAGIAAGGAYTNLFGYVTNSSGIRIGFHYLFISADGTGAGIYTYAVTNVSVTFRDVAQRGAAPGTCGHTSNGIGILRTSNANGTGIVVRQLTNTNTTIELSRIASDGTNWYVLGLTNEVNGQYDLLLASWTSANVFQWAKRITRDVTSAHAAVGIAVDSTGIYICEGATGGIGKISLDGTTKIWDRSWNGISGPISFTFTPIRITVNSSRGELYVSGTASNTTGHMIVCFDTTNGYVKWSNTVSFGGSVPTLQSSFFDNSTGLYVCGGVGGNAYMAKVPTNSALNNQSGVAAGAVSYYYQPSNNLWTYTNFNNANYQIFNATVTEAAGTVTITNAIPNGLASEATASGFTHTTATF